jgi:uncharacterized protein
MEQLSESFVLQQSVERTWDTFQDVPRVAACMPGFEYLGQTGPEKHKGRVRLKLGPVTASFEGEATFTEIDPERRLATLKAQGVDKKGGSRATARVSYRLEPVGTGETRVDLSGDIELTGALARVGRGSIIKDVARHLTDQFARNLEAMLRSGTEVEAAPPTDGHDQSTPQTRAEVHELSLLTLLKSILRGWLSRIGRRPGAS